MTNESIIQTGTIPFLEDDDFLTAHFKLCEFQKEYDRIPVDALAYERLMRLALLMERIRGVFQCPIKITSGYRSYEHNKRVKGSAKVSQHSYMRACDFRPIGRSLQFANTTCEHMHKYIEKNYADLGVGGLGWYPVKEGRPYARIHVDTRPCDGNLRQWEA